MCLYQLVHPEGAGITGRLLVLNVTVKVVGMEGAEQAAACLRLQAPYLSVIGVAHGTGPAHFHQLIAVGEQGQFALPAPAALFPHDPHVHIVGVQIQDQGTLVRFVAQQLPSYKPFHRVGMRVLTPYFKIYLENYVRTGRSLSYINRATNCGLVRIIR